MTEPINVPIVTAISGNPKTGKTHLAFTFPGPIAYFEFDIRGAAPVLHKFPDKQIDVYAYPLPIIDSDPPELYAFDLTAKFFADYQDVIESGKYQTIVLDTTSMIWRIIGHAEAEALNQKKILKVQYYRPNLRMNSIFTRGKIAGVNMVAIQYLKDVYRADQPTGEQASDGWTQIEATADVIIWTARKSLGKDKTGVTFEATIMANRYEPNADGTVLRDTSYGEIYAMLGL